MANGTHSVHGGNGRVTVTDEATKEELMHLRRQLSNIVKLALPALDTIENLLEVPEDRRIKIER